MLRIRAVEELLVDLAGVRVAPEDGEGDGGPGAVAREWRRRARFELERARKKSLGMAFLCVVAVAILLVTHAEPGRFLAFEGEDVVFTVGILLIMGYGGYRLGQWDKLRSVERVLEELAERE
jgi:hypothetical protein